MMTLLALLLLVCSLKSVCALTCHDWDGATLGSNAAFQGKTIKDNEINGTTPLTLSSSRNSLTCLATCINDPDCFSVNYQQETRECKKFSDDWYRAMPKLVNSTGWDFLYLMDKATPLGMIDKTIPDEALSGQKVKRPIRFARLGQDYAWGPLINQKMTVDLGSIAQMVGITHKGCKSCTIARWLEKYTLSYSFDEISWEDLPELNGNTDTDTPVYDQLDFTARYLRITAGKTYSAREGAGGFRFEVYGFRLE